MLYPSGHKTLNKKYIELLSHEYNIVLVDYNDYFSNLQLQCANVSIVKVYQKFPTFNFLLKLKKIFPFIFLEPFAVLNYFRNIMYILFAVRKIKYDHIMFFTARNDALFLALPFISVPVSVFHHNDIDMLRIRKFERFSFLKSKNRIHHIVLAEFIADYLINHFCVSVKNVHVVYQPLIGENEGYVNLSNRNNIAYGLGQTCDVSMLKEVIENDKKHINFSMHIVLRNTNLTYKGKNVDIIQKYLTRKEYDTILNNYRTCVVLYPYEYQMRYSGVIDDALSHGMYVIGNDIPVVRYYSQKYPKSCFIIKTVEELFDEKWCKIEANSDEIYDFTQSHSDKHILSQLNIVLSC